MIVLTSKANYKGLNNDIIPLKVQVYRIIAYFFQRDGDEWKRLERYIKSTQEGDQTILDIFAIDRHGMEFANRL